MIRNTLTGLMILFLFMLVVFIMGVLSSLIPSGWVVAGFVTLVTIICANFLGDIYNNWNDGWDEE